MRYLCGTKLNSVRSLTSLILTSVLFTFYSLVDQFTDYTSYNTPVFEQESDGYVMKSPHIMKVGEHDQILSQWSGTITEACAGHFIGYSNYFIRLKDVVVDLNYGQVAAVGGGDVNTAIAQDANDEVYKVTNGFFQLPCEVKPAYKLIGDDQGHIQKWFNSIRYSNTTQFNYYLDSLLPAPSVEKNFTIALVRYEYHNVYWTIIDMYNVFLTAKFLNKPIDEVNVLLVDEHPHGNLDDLFKGTFYAKQLHEYSEVTLFRDMVWAPSRHHSGMLEMHKTIPFIHEFQEAVFKRFKLPRTYRRDCSFFNILLIWRRDYTANPRQSKVSRKIGNEQELLTALNLEFYEHASITAVQLDLLPIREQLQLFSTSDIVLGMHGAAFGFSIFMPPGGAAIELFPYYSIPNWHMEYLARWANVTHVRWINFDKKLEDKKRDITIISPSKIVDLLHRTIGKMCK